MIDQIGEPKTSNRTAGKEAKEPSVSEELENLKQQCIGSGEQALIVCIDTIMDLGLILRKARKSAKLTQKQLAKIAETSQSTIAQLEIGGQKSGPTIRKISELLYACGYRLEFSLKWNGKPPLRVIENPNNYGD